MNEAHKGRALGVGGIFFRSQDPARLGAWYAEYLGLQIEAWGYNAGHQFCDPRICRLIRLPFGALLRQTPNILAHPVRGI